MMVTERFWWISIIILAIFSLTSECREVMCYKCSWIGTQELTEEKIKQLDEQHKKMSSLSTPIDNPLTQPYVESLTPLTEEQLISKCGKCTLANGYCASWSFLVNNIPQNVTYMCVQSVAEGETGVFYQSMGTGETKRVVLCNKSYCNKDSSAFELKPSLALPLAVIFLSFYKVTYK